MNVMKKILIVFMLGLLGWACSEEEVETYRLNDFVYFGPRTVLVNGNYQSVWDTLQLFNFSYHPGVKDTTIRLTVLTGGFVTDYDRSFRVSYSSEGAEGVDFEAVPEYLTIPAGANRGYVPVTLHYTEKLETTPLAIRIDLLPSDDFTIDQPKRLVDGFWVSRIGSVIMFTSELTPPELYTYYEKNFIGYFSRVKFDKMNEVWGTTITDWLDPESALYRNFKAYMAYFGNYLNQQIAKGAGTAIKDPSPYSERGYMTIKGDEYFGISPTVIPAHFPDAR